MIVFPAIDLRKGRVVRLLQGQADTEMVYDDDPAAVARRWVAEGAKWLHVINLDGALETDNLPTSGDLPINWWRLQEICAAVPNTPIQFGGGLRTLAAAEMALELGAARVLLGTAAVCQPKLVRQAVQRFGPERIAVSIDVRDGKVAKRGWQEGSTITATALGTTMRQRGVRYAVYTDIHRDGMLNGVNVAATARLAKSSGLRLIAAGGVASLDDVRRLRQRAVTGIEGVIIGQALYCGTLSLAEALQAAS